MKLYFAGNLDWPREEAFAPLIPKRLISWYVGTFANKLGYWEKIMKLYLAGFGSGITKEQSSTYYDDFKIKELRAYPEVKLEDISKTKCSELFIDSGAYSAWTKGIDINIDKYIEFLHKWKENIAVYANLDVIPGKVGETITNEQKAYSAQKGWDNCKYMESCGLKPMHIFHQGEDFAWLKKMMDKFEYFGISPGNDYSVVEKDLWLHDVYSYLCNADGSTKWKTHGFGITAESIMEKYPFYSVDSTTWILTSRFGSVYTPWGKILVSNDPKSNNEPDHYRFKLPQEKEQLDFYFMEHGSTPDLLAKSYKERDRMNIVYLLDYEKNYVYTPVPKQQHLWCLIDGSPLVKGGV